MLYYCLLTHFKPLNSATHFNGHNMYYLFKTYDLFDSNPKSVTTTFF